MSYERINRPQALVRRRARGTAPGMARSVTRGRLAPSSPAPNYVRARAGRGAMARPAGMAGYYPADPGLAFSLKPPRYLRKLTIKKALKPLAIAAAVAVPFLVPAVGGALVAAGGAALKVGKAGAGLLMRGGKAVGGALLPHGTPPIASPSSPPFSIPSGYSGPQIPTDVAAPFSPASAAGGGGGGAPMMPAAPDPSDGSAPAAAAPATSSAMPLVLGAAALGLALLSHNHSSRRA